MSARRIPAFESDAFISRIREVIGEESVSSFSRRCGVGESTLRNLFSGASPRADILVSIANAGGVTVDWLATGRLPKTRVDLRVMQMAELIADFGSLTDSENAVLIAKRIIGTQVDLTPDDEALLAKRITAKSSSGASGSAALLFEQVSAERSQANTGAAEGETNRDIQFPVGLRVKTPAPPVQSVSEDRLLATYRAASAPGRNALDKVAAAIDTQTMSAWFSAGQAITEAANIFDKKK